MSDEKYKIYLLGTIEDGAADGGDIFAVVGCDKTVTFGEMVEGVEVIEKAAYDKLKKENVELNKYIDVLGIKVGNAIMALTDK